MPTVNITINGQKITAQAGQTILEAARSANIDIPVLCYHPALNSWGGCRVCLVEVAKQRCLQPACTFPISEGMEVWTESEKVVSVRKFVLELLFSERNHYCMFCQMSGGCELQALAYRYGLDHWTYPRPYDKLDVDGTRDYFVMDQNRCVLCRRCIRACAEITANHTLGVHERGAHSMIMADHNVPFGESSCVECGTCLQVCPTGALIDRHSAYGGREKDVTHTKTTCTQCSVGCTLDVSTRHQRVLRVDGAWEEGPSAGLLCVAGRFEPVYEVHPRITGPMIRKDGALAPAEWDDALALAAQKLAAGSAAGLTACESTNEALQAFSDLFGKARGTVGRIGPALPYLGFGRPARVEDVAASDLFIVAGADPLAGHKVVGYLIKRAIDKGARLALVGEVDSGLSGYADWAVSDTDIDKIVEIVGKAERPLLVYGAGITAAAIAGLKSLGDKVFCLGLEPASNGQGACACLSEASSLAHPQTVFLSLGEASADGVLDTLPAGAFKIVQACYHSPAVDQADLVLPAPIWSERAGTVTTLDGRVAELTPALHMPAGVRPEAAVLQALASMMRSG